MKFTVRSQQVEAIKELTVKQIGFIAINGFAEREEPYLYLDGNDIFCKRISTI